MDRDDIETDEERKRRLSRPVRLPRITAPPRCQDNVAREVWGTSFVAHRSPFAALKEKGERNARWRAKLREGTEVVGSEPECDPRWAEKADKSVKGIVFAIAALVAIVVVMKWTTPVAES